MSESQLGNPQSPSQSQSQSQSHLKPKAVVLLSSGLDSSVNLFASLSVYQVVLAVTFNYGQRAADREIECSSRLAQVAQVPHRVVDLSWFRDFGKSSLLDQSLKIPGRDQVAIESQEKSEQTAKSVWVPNRNGIFLNIAAGYAESLGAKVVIPGFNKEEAATFPDNSSDFMHALTKSFSFSTSNQVEVHCLTDRFDKTEIVKLGQATGLPFSLLWPCYHNFLKWCGECESCQRFARALKNAGVSTQGLFLHEM